MRLRNAPKDELNDMLKTYTKFMFTRDPFSKIFSAYVDKLLVPEIVGLNLITMIKHL
jgi:hypothetical protein